MNGIVEELKKVKVFISPRSKGPSRVCALLLPSRNSRGTRISVAEISKRSISSFAPIRTLSFAECTTTAVGSA